MKCSPKAYDAVVVGAGVAGLTCAAYLCRSDLSTLVLEKQDYTGGLVGSFTHEGFVFDRGARAFENSGILFPMLKQLGIDMSFQQSEVSLIIGDQRVRLKDVDSLNEYTDALKKSFPHNHSDIDRIIKEIRRAMDDLDILYGIDNPLFAKDLKDKDYLKSELLPWFKKFILKAPHMSRMQKPVYEHLRRFTNNESLIDVIAQHFFQNTPTFFALSYFSLYLDYTYPLGGTGSLPHALTSYIEQRGGEVRAKSEVTSIYPNSHELLLADGRRVAYKKLIWAADQSTFYAITQSDSSKFLRQQKIVEESHGADSVLSLFIGLDQDVSSIASKSGPHAFYTPKTSGVSALPNWRDSLEEKSLYDWLSRYLECTTYEISCPALRDPALAPQGQVGIIVSTLMDYDLTQRFKVGGNYQEFKDFCSNKIIDVIEQLYPHLRSSITFAICSTPTSIERINNSKEGAITGWAFTNSNTPSEMSFLKISKAVKTPLEDIFQCGQWVFSPSGVPTCILTGKLAADQVIKESELQSERS